MTATTQRVLDLMKKQNLKAHQLEIAANLPNASVQNWVKGKKCKSGEMRYMSPSSEAITKLARYFNVSADYLLCLTDKPTPLIKEQPTAVVERYTTTLSTELAELSNDKDFVNSAKLYRVVDDEYKKEICAYIFGIAIKLGVDIAKVLSR
ncbi:MAG: helix-turn-helix domain-containing protein [Roseburia sp.]|nr:helix-turn-helix domain-containing protein [Roseburia sp.]